jgi:hypothetical protein
MLGHAFTILFKFKLVIIFIEVKPLTIATALAVFDVHLVAAHFHALVFVPFQTDGIVTFIQNPLLAAGGAASLDFSPPATVLHAPLTLSLFCA